MNRHFAVLPWIIALLFCSALRAEPSGPLQLVKMTADQVVERITQQRSVLEENPGLIYETVNELVLPRFDFERMAQLVLGKYWPRATAKQREEFVVQFRELLVRTYATTLLNYSDQSIDYLPLRMANGDTEATVNTRISSGGAPPIPIDYRLLLNQGEWKVYDVAIDNVSLVSQYRRSYANHINRYQLDGLLQRMRQLNVRNR